VNKVFLHVDLDAFFASVEQLDHPEYRGKPVIVGGLPGDRRSVVSTASYEARRFGVHSAMPTFQAIKLCPQGIFVRGRMKRYHEKSEEVMNIFKEYSPDIHQISVDEAFIDLTGTERLFGDPVETAKRLKAEVLEKTGLTVSVGLASTKYCAKIASGLQKPDGLTVVPFGKETEFMLSLPIEKIWGAGNKTLEKLKNSGIKSTRDIYNRSENLLRSLFGNATGTFLYNSVRGNAGADFRAEPKSRSISAENTYEYDLTNKDIIETALLSLCHTVMFRSLREKVRSSCVSLKIRYEDFSTVSVQSTSERYVSSVDDLFERTKSLLEKKCDSKLGIRLLGVAMQNLEDETTPCQQELFDFGEEKKRKLESAILKAQEKNPNIKITKARLLGETLLALTMLVLPLNKTQAEMATSTEKEADGAGSIVFDTSKLPLSDSGNFVSIFNKNFGEQNIEFFAEGYWKSTVKGGLAYSFGFGTTPTLSTTSPVFAQNVDLSLYFMLNHHWYFEAAFADEFSKNTVGAGYIGDGYLKSARISNRKIIFPSIYSVDDVNRGIGGGENQAPGLSFNWAGQNWQADAAFRYDLLEAHEKSWYGKNSVSINEISLSSYNTGNQYILPNAPLIANVKDIYVENAFGDYKDSKGRKYKKLDKSQYLLLAAEKQILISNDAKAYRQNGTLPAVAATFYIPASQSDFGDYDDDSTFLGKVQKWFNGNQESKNPKIKLKNYSYPIFNSIDGEDCVFLQYPGGFSPFVVANRYDCGVSSATDAQVANFSTGTADSNYNAVIDEDSLRFAETDFFYSNHIYADIYRNNDEDEADETEKQIRASFPMANESPEIYLGSSSSKMSGKVLQVRSFTPVNRFEIGTDAVKGTVTVYKNGMIDSGASYDEESGTITLSSSAGSTDHIRALWYEESEDSSSGALAAAGGFKYDFTQNVSGDISTSVRWGYTPEQETADSSTASPGYATLASKISYTDERLSAQNTMAASYENTNTTGNYRILGNDESHAGTYYLIKKAGINLPSSFSPVLNEKTHGDTNHIELKQGKNGSVDASEGKNDSEISGYALPLEWNFAGIEAGNENDAAWSAKSLYTPSLSGILANASTFSIALKNASYAESFNQEKCALYLQLGISADEDFSIEESERIPTWKISEAGAEQVQNPFSFSKPGWQTIKIALSDEDRSIISSLQNFNARLILTTTDTSSLPKNGTIFMGPYEPGEQVFAFSGSDQATTTNYQTTDASLYASKIRKFNKSSTNKIQFFEWNFNSEQEEAQELSFTRYFQEVSLSEYKNLSFFMKAENAESVKITLSRPKSTGESTAIVYTIKNPASSWLEYTIDLTDSTNPAISFLDTDIVPTKIKIEIHTKRNGTLSFDELYLSENNPFIVLEDKFKADYKIDGLIFGTENHEILKNFKASLNTNTASSIESEKMRSKENAIQSAGNIGFTLSNIKVNSSLNLSNAYRISKSDDLTQKNALSSASHSFESEKPFLNLLSFSENYTFSAEEGSLEKADGMKIDFSGYNVPVAIETGTKASSDVWSLNQDAQAKASFKTSRLSLSSTAKLSQKIPTNSSSESSSKKEKFQTENYASSWGEITRFSFDSGDEKASKRNVSLNSKLDYSFDTAKLKPSVTFETKGDYKSSSKNTFSDTTKAGFEIPFTLSKNNFSFSWKKSAGSTSSVEKGGDYKKDTNSLQESLGEKDYFFKALPVYDFISSSLSTGVFENNRESNYYTGLYTFTWKRAFFANKYDFFIPQTAKFEATRDIRTGTSTADFYQIKNTVTYTALNIFGRNGTLPLFSVFANDEYNSSFSTAIKIPRQTPGNFTYLLSGYIQATFYFSTNNYLKNGLESTLGGKHDWKTKYTLIWKRPAENSLAKGLVSIFSKKKAENILKITKTDSMNISLSCASSTSAITRKYSVDYIHATETQVSKFISLNTDLGLNYYALWEKSATLSASATLGATIKF